MIIPLYKLDAPQIGYTVHPLSGGRQSVALLSLVARKPVFGVSDQVRHKSGCTTIEDGYRLEILDLESRWIVLSMWRKQRR